MTTSICANRPGETESVAPELLDVRTVASMLGCSPRHVYRLFDAGRLPRPVRLGTLVRWRRAELALWIDDGCKPVSTNAAQQRGGA